MMVKENDESYHTIFINLFSSSEEDISGHKPFQIGYVIICVILGIFGICGMSLNGWAIYLFTKTKTVSIEYMVFLVW